MDRERRSKLVVGPRGQGTHALALWCQETHGVMVCHSYEEAAGIRRAYNITTVCSLEPGCLRSLRCNIAIDNWLMHEKPRVLLADALIATSGTGSEVVCGMSNWFDILSLKEFCRHYDLPETSAAEDEESDDE